MKVLPAFEIDPTDVVVGERPIRGTEERDAYSIDELHAVALGHTETPADALRLLLFTVQHVADRSARPDDVLTAAIAVLRELRDGPSAPPDAGDEPVVEQAFDDLDKMPVPPNPSADEIIAYADDTRPMHRLPPRKK